MIATASWADFGFRRLPVLELGANSQRFVEILRSRAGYEIRDDHWIRHPGRVISDRAVEVRVVSQCSATDLASWSTEFVYDFFSWFDQAHADIGPRLHAQIEHLVKTVEKAESESTERPWRHLAQLSVAMGTCPFAGQFASVCRNLVLPSFFRRWPTGKCTFLRHSQARLPMLAAMRSLYTNTVVDAWLNQQVGAFEALNHVHGGDPHNLFASVMGLAQILWYPHVTGYLSDNYCLNALFALNPTGLSKPTPFPSSWLDTIRRNAEFGLEDRDPLIAIKNHPGPQYQEFSHRRPICASPPSRSALDEFTAWLIPAVDRWIFNLCDVANFTTGHDKNADIDGLSAFEHLMTIERLARRVIDVSTSTDVGAAKTIVFEVADLISELLGRFLGTPKSAERFKDLFNPDVATLRFGPALESIPGVGHSLATQLREAYLDLKTSVINSVWIKGKVTPSGILVRNQKLTAENEEPAGVFTANVVRALRNAHHGYFTDQDNSKRPSRYLALVTGEIPDSLVVLPALWFFAYLADHSLLGWAPMPVGGFAA